MRFNKNIFYLSIVFFLFVSFSFVFAQVDLELNKEYYSSKETMIARISINEQPVRQISAADISLNQGSIAPLILQPPGNVYYAYFNIPSLEDGEYDFYVKLLYNTNNILSTKTFSKSFTVNNEAASLSVSPAVIKVDALKMLDYQVYVKNNNKDIVDVSISEDLEYASISKSQVSIEKNNQKSFFITIDKNKIKSNETGFITLNYDSSSIEIPLIIYNFVEETPVQPLQTQEAVEPQLPVKNTSVPSSNVPQPKANVTSPIVNYANQSSKLPQNVSIKNASYSRPLVFVSVVNDNEKRLKNIMLNIKKNSSMAGSLFLRNSLNMPITSLEFSMKGNIAGIIRFNQTVIGEVMPNSRARQYIFINELKDANSSIYEGLIFVNSTEGYSASLPVFIMVEDNRNIIERSASSVSKIFSKEDNKEDYEESSEIFNFTSKYDSSQQSYKKSSFWPIFILVIVAVIAAYIFYRKMKKGSTRTFDDYLSSLYGK